MTLTEQQLGWSNVSLRSPLYLLGHEPFLIYLGARCLRGHPVPSHRHAWLPQGQHPMILHQPGTKLFQQKPAEKNISMFGPEPLYVHQGWAAVLTWKCGFSYESWHSLPWQNFSRKVHIQKVCSLNVSSDVAVVHLLEGTPCCIGHTGNYWLLYVCLHEQPNDFFAWNSYHSENTCTVAPQYGFWGAPPVSCWTGTSSHRNHNQRFSQCHASPENHRWVVFSTQGINDLMLQVLTFRWYFKPAEESQCALQSGQT